ncbi:hypothetical protein K2173_013775 [Erythroxylum novogranatense]|uniref:Transmembrane protein 230 n=1 Tax=Erythroxylum novogranatense TaxID=1862640 RepID=A0AAV8SCE8_9ROSI|nr:hypothetical protein K2173_013775 [Erythroxylum novogranatense]
MTTRCNIHYNRLPNDEHGDHDNGTKRYNPRFDYSPGSFDKIPRKSIALAFCLLFLGSILLFLSYFILSGHMGGETSQAYGLFALGILTFLPGFYETRTAYYSWRGAKGHHFSSIPSY